MTKYTKKSAATQKNFLIPLNLSWVKIIKKSLFVIALSLPVLAFIYTFAIANRYGVLYGDWDYFAQAYEAARQSILTYHQFPWWNPWVIGGVPLYANPQFGLISIQMPLVLLFGTVVGLHLAVLIYYLLGFWGMFCLLRRLGAGGLLRSLLAYIWVFGSFPAWHIAGGHLTFASYLLAPWLFLALLNIRQKYGWLWFGLLGAFLINQTMHYSVIQVFFVAGLFAIYEIIRCWRKKDYSWWEILRPYILAAVTIILLAGPRVFFTFQYLHHYTRIPATEYANSSGLILDSLALHQPIDPVQTFHAQFGWAEYTAYYGLPTLLVVIYFALCLYERREFKRRDALLVFAMIFFLLLSIGPFASWSPYSLLRDLPVFQQMQVASRWLGWFGLAMILFLARLPRRGFIYLLLMASVVDVFITSRAATIYPQPTYKAPLAHAATIDEQAFYKNQPDIRRSSLRFLSATQSNIGDVFGYEPLGEFSIVADDDFSKGLTIRCGSNQTDCPLVLTKNARITSWSPQYFVLERTGDGYIELNMNPGNNWFENNHPLFNGHREFETRMRFIIKDPAQKIVVQYKPHL